MPPIYPPWLCGISGANETLQLVVDILQHFPEKQNQVQPLYKTDQQKELKDNIYEKIIFITMVDGTIRLKALPK